MDGYFQTINKIKEEVCYVERNIREALSIANRNKIHYVLPDPDIKKSGYCVTDPTGTDHLQKLIMTKERFLIPNVVFEPKSVGLDQGGLTETLFESIHSIHPDFYGPAVGNISLVGCNTMFDGFYKKFCEEVRANTNQFCDIGVEHIKDENAILKGMNSFTLGETFADLAFAKQMYNERGGSFLATLF